MRVVDVATRVGPLATTMAIATSSKDRLTQAQEAEPARREQLLRAIVDEPSGPCNGSDVQLTVHRCLGRCRYA